MAVMICMHHVHLCVCAGRPTISVTFALVYLIPQFREIVLPSSGKALLSEIGRRAYCLVIEVTSICF